MMQVLSVQFDVSGWAGHLLARLVPASVSRVCVWLIDGVNCTLAKSKEKYQNV
jgi:hypothetical protein